MARPARFERATLCLEGRCSIQLSYGRSNLNFSHNKRLCHSLLCLWQQLRSAIGIRLECRESVLGQRLPRAEDAEEHSDLARMVNGVLHDSAEHPFVGICAARNLSCQFSNGRISDSSLQQVPALAPTIEELIPGNRWLGPFSFRLPDRHRLIVRRFSNPFVPQENVLEQG